MGQLVSNGGMELFTGNIPTDWSTTTPLLISQITAQGRVHSGVSSVNLSDGANLSQTVFGINPGCFYEFSFFAHGEGSAVAVTATVVYQTTTGDVPGAAITVNMGDIPDGNREFGYYRAITSAAPANVISATIEFDVTATGGQSLDIDDVSLW
jgi:hypothetical protein